MYRRLIPILVISTIVLMSVSSFASSRWVQVGASGPRKPEATVLKSDATETIIRFDIHGFWTREISENGETFNELRFPGYATTMEIGRPELPCIADLVAIPDGSGVSVSVIESEEVVFGDYKVYPFQKPLFEGEKRAGFEIDRAFYETDALYPQEPAVIGEPGIWRDLRVTRVQVNPIRYNPANSEIRIYSSITVRLAYDGTGSRNIKAGPDRPVLDTYDRMYKRSVLNYDQLGLDVQDEDAPLLTEGEYDYLFIVEDGYASNIAPLVSHKESLGMVTKVTLFSEIAGGSPTDVRDYIQSEYETAGIKYVLIVGDEDDIPGYTGYGFFSDYYYALVDGTDDYADIGVGRFSVINTGQVDNLVDKSITYEANPPATGWLEKSLLIANWELAPDKYTLCKEQVRLAEDTPSGTYSILYPDFDLAYGASYANGGNEATDQDVIDFINAGTRLVNYRGHGSETAWTYWNVDGDYFNSTDVAQLAAGDMSPVVFSIACLNNDLLYSNECFGEIFTRGAEGAVAYLGASDPSYTTTNHTYDKQLYSLIYDEGVVTISDASNEASVRAIPAHGSYGLIHARMYLGLGEPSLAIISDIEPPPPPPELVSPDEGAYFDDGSQVPLDWSDVTEATFYHVQVDNDVDFSSPVSEMDTLIASEWTTQPLSNSIYYWRVRLNNGTSYSTWSEVRSFTVGIVVTAPTLLSPSNNSRVKISSDFTLEWYRVAGAPGYVAQITQDPNFVSPKEITAFLCTNGTCLCYVSPPPTNGTWYWRVRVDIDGWPWSEVWSFNARGRIVPSCPVLYSFDGGSFHMENTLLTACESSGYTKSVTDYYLVGGQVAEFDGKALFQLREMEDEITYLEGVELITVDHEPDSRIGCTVDGRIFTYENPSHPLTAIDHEGNDLRNVLLSKDSEVYEATGPGYIELNFATSGSDIGLIIDSQDKKPCLLDTDDVSTKGGSIEQIPITIEVYSTSGWVELSGVPTREISKSEMVPVDMELPAEGHVKVRVSWEESFSADLIEFYSKSKEEPKVAFHTVSRHELTSDHDVKRSWPADADEPFELYRGDIFEFEFGCGDGPAEGMVRDYIIKAVGRYQPDYSVYTNLVPKKTELYSNYPNPFNPATTIHFDLHKPGHVTLEVFNVAGQKVRTLVNEIRKEGHHEITWDGQAGSGVKVTSGMYFYRLTTENAVVSRKMLLLR